MALIAWENWNCCGIQNNNGTDSSNVFMLKLGEKEFRSELSGLVYSANGIQAKRFLTGASAHRIKGSASCEELRNITILVPSPGRTPI